MNFGDLTFWAGTETSYEAVIRAQAAVCERLAAGHSDFDEDDDEEEFPRLLNISENGIATIKIEGSLVNSDSPWLRVFGLTGYPEIRNAMIRAAEDESVKHIMLDVNSPGGAVSGVSDLANLIRTINTSVKPVTAFSDSIAASGGYWLASSAGKVYGSKVALFGSIGVITVHKEYTEMYKAEGIGVTVIRAGEEKALANPNEKLSEGGRKQIEEVLQATYSVFVEHVANARGKSEQFVRENMAEGKQFVGPKAVDASLIDGIVTYDQLVGSISEQLIDERSSNSNTFRKFAAAANLTLEGESSMSKKRSLTEAQIAALSAGIPVEQIEAGAGDAADGALAEAAAVADADAGTADSGEPAGTKAQAEGESVNTADLSVMSGKVELLTSQLATANATLLAANVELARMTEKYESLQAQVAPLTTIVGTAVNGMRIACNMASVDFASMSAEQILKEHASVSETFKKNFPIGGVASVEHEDTVDKKSGFKLDNVTAARMRALNSKY